MAHHHKPNTTNVQRGIKLITTFGTDRPTGPFGADYTEYDARPASTLSSPSQRTVLTTFGFPHLRRARDELSLLFQGAGNSTRFFLNM
jgi:hypothetical protein